MSDPTNTEQTTPQDVGSQTGEPTAPEGQAGIQESLNNAQGGPGKGDISDATPDEVRPDRDTSEEPRNDRSDDEPDTFPRAYVEKLRRENADARSKVKDRDDLAARLHTALAAADGRLADPTDLPFSEDHLDPEAMGKAIADLITRKPHLKAIRVKGDAGQGPRGHNAPQVDLLGTLRNLAG